LIDKFKGTTDRLPIPHQDIHDLRRRARRCLGGKRRRERQPQAKTERARNAQHQMPNVRRLPVVVTNTLSPIWLVASCTKFNPLQCMGMTTSGSSAFTSATTCLR